MVAEPVRETGDPRRVVELREQTRRQKSRSGDVPDHQEDHQQIERSTWKRSTTRPSTSRFRRISLTKAVVVTVVIEEIVTQIPKQCTERFGERDSTSGFELDLRYSERAS